MLDLIIDAIVHMKNRAEERRQREAYERQRAEWERQQFAGQFRGPMPAPPPPLPGPLDESLPGIEDQAVPPPDGLPGARRRSGGSSAVF